MYFFLSNLASIDIAYSSSVTPNMLANFLVKQNTISYIGCSIQFGSTAFWGTVECFLLAVMAYDRFVAICNQLLYSTKMSTEACIQLVLGSYIGGFLTALSFILSFFLFIFCGPNRINHFFCDCSFGGTLLFRCQCLCTCYLIFCWFSHCDHSVCHSHLLYLHPYHHPEDALH
jgi:olfactory receptor